MDDGTGTMNFTMLHALEAGDAIDLSARPREGDDFVLDRVVAGKDYCVFDTEEWIWSIGRRKSDGRILASTTYKFYCPHMRVEEQDFECLWLR